ncbi:MAG: zinc ribbon domain-containing protein [Chloroflexi bacterium]|nr:zinc ribbon domain-containing protein [Chloroflexota bacterium]
MNCSTCQTPIQPGAAFCDNCGTPVSTSQPTPPAAAPLCPAAELSAPNAKQPLCQVKLFVVIVAHLSHKRQPFLPINRQPRRLLFISRQPRRNLQFHAANVAHL